MRKAMAALALIGTASVASAQTDGVQYMSVEDMEIVNAAGEQIGEIEEILVGQDGMLAAYLVEIGGFLGMGEHEVALPMDALSFAGDRFQTDMTKDQLEALPEWDD